MDSWKYLSEGKDVWLSEELDFPVDDGHGSCKNKTMGGEIKPLFNVENYPLVSNTQALERLDFMDLGFSDDQIRKSYSVSSEPSGEAFSDEIGTDSYGNVVSGSRISNRFLQSNNQDFPLIDLKLGRLADGGGAKDGEFSKAKRARLTTLYHRPPCCQVLGCNKDLSSCKGYYKRHKVCDVHTKTTKVIVDGIEQRFCQQCSRFHLLAEFDDRKRSCHRRLAAHNKRRRKPQLTSESGARIICFSSSFGFPEMLPSAVVGSGEEMGNTMANMKDNILGFQRLSSIQQTSTRALSLLSAQSHNMSSQLLGADHVEHTTLSHYDDHTADLTIPGDCILRGPDLRNNSNYHNPLGRGIILDLLQLSSHLQRIEQQKHSTESEVG